MSPDLKFINKFESGTINSFANTFFYNFYNQNKDRRLVKYLTKPLHIDITDPSGAVVIGSCTLDIFSTVGPALSEYKAYEVDIFDSKGFRLGSLQLSLKVNSYE